MRYCFSTAPSLLACFAQDRCFRGTCITFSESIHTSLLMTVSTTQHLSLFLPQTLNGIRPPPSKRNRLGVVSLLNLSQEALFHSLYSETLAQSG